MIFVKNKKTPKTDAASTLLKKRTSRYDCLAVVSIDGFEGQAALKNISTEGGCIVSRTYAVLKPGNEYVIRVIPPGIPDMVPFKINIEIKWVKSTEAVFNAGFMAAASPMRNRALESYLNYIKTGRTFAV
jgi:hypothetical protein